MSKPIPAVQKFMTTAPHTIGHDQPLAMASKMMHEHRIRHLPVLDGGNIVGLLSERDLALVESLTGVDPHSLKVEEAMSQQPFTTSPDSPLDEVVTAMAENRYGAAVVVQNNHVVGILTTVDVCRALADLLHTRLK